MANDVLLLQQEAQWRAWGRDPKAFIEEAAYIRHPRDGRIPFKLRDAQREALRDFEEHDRVIVLKARQLGFSTLLAVYVLWLTMFRADMLVIFLSRTERLAIDLLAKVKYAYNLLPAWVKQRGPALVTDTQTKLTFANGSEIESLPSQSDPARGRTVSLVVVDEWASLENPEDAWASIEPIADIGGRIIGLSTAKGWGDFFHGMWVRASNGTSRFHPIFFPYSAVPERDEQWYERQKGEMLSWQIAQEYPRTEDEAFVKSGNPVFDVDQIQQWVFEEPKRGYLWHGGGTREFRASRQGELRVWEMPEPVAPVMYVVGADVAEGLEHGDYSSAHVINSKTGLVAAHWHGHIDPDEFGIVLAQLGWFYRRALVGVEQNGHGLTTLTEMRRQGYPAIYFTWILDDRTRKRTSKIGWRTTRSSKPYMIDELRKALRRDEDNQADLIVRCSETAAELRTYVRDEKGATNGSPFDDRVISLAVAQQMRAHALSPEQRVAPNHEWTLAWWEAQGQEPPGPTPIGSHNLRKVA